MPPDLQLMSFSFLWLFPLGVPPGTTAGVFAVGAVGLKNAVQALWEERSQPSRETPQMLTERYTKLLALFGEFGESNLATELEKAHRLWRNGIDDDGEFGATMAALIAKYKTGQRPANRKAKG